MNNFCHFLHGFSWGVKIGNNTLKFTEFAKKKFRLKFFIKSILFSLTIRICYDTFGHSVLKILQIAVLKTPWSTGKAMQSLQSAMTPRILTLHNSKYISQNWTTVWLYYQSYKIGTCWFKVDDCFVGWTNCGRWKKRCIFQTSI